MGFIFYFILRVERRKKKGGKWSLVNKLAVLWEMRQKKRKKRVERIGHLCVWWFSGSRGECYHHHHHFEGKEKIIKPNRVECFPCEVPCKTISFFSLFFFVRFINQDWIWWTHTKSSVDDCGQQLPTTWWSLFSNFFFS